MSVRVSKSILMCTAHSPKKGFTLKTQECKYYAKLADMKEKELQLLLNSTISTARWPWVSMKDAEDSWWICHLGQICTVTVVYNLNMFLILVHLNTQVTFYLSVWYSDRQLPDSHIAIHSSFRDKKKFEKPKSSILLANIPTPPTPHSWELHLDVNMWKQWENSS